MIYLELMVSEDIERMTEYGKKRETKVIAELAGDNKLSNRAAAAMLRGIADELDPKPGKPGEIKYTYNPSGIIS